MKIAIAILIVATLSGCGIPLRCKVVKEGHSMNVYGEISMDTEYECPEDAPR
jgi:hypothetical protein